MVFSNYLQVNKCTHFVFRLLVHLYNTVKFYTYLRTVCMLQICAVSHLFSSIFSLYFPSHIEVVLCASLSWKIKECSWHPYPSDHHTLANMNSWLNFLAVLDLDLQSYAHFPKSNLIKQPGTYFWVNHAYVWLTVQICFKYWWRLRFFQFREIKFPLCFFR